MHAEDLTHRIRELPVFDTHSHLNAPGRPLWARGFADLGHYFWLSQQLKGVGWQEGGEIDERSAGAYFDAFTKTENTTMNWCLRRILLDLYGLEIRSPGDVLEADRAIRDRSGSPAHVEKVCRKGNIRKVVQNLSSQASFPEVSWLGVLVADTLNAPVVACLEDPSEAAVERAACVLAEAVDNMAKGGHAGARIDYDLYESLRGPMARKTLLDAVFSRLHHHNMFVQVFVGMVRQSRGSYPQHDPTRITGLYPFFRAYPNCRFELVCAAEGNTMDVVQAAVINPNVNPGGLWWYSFRPSVFLQSMQWRLEALAPMKCPLVASDATCIEWCYGKSMLVKELVARFMARQVEGGWLSEECAVRTASAWLHDAPASYYGSKGLA